MKQLLLISLITLATISCTKHKDDIESPVPKGSIQFSKPTQGALFNSGDIVTIEATAISTASIHGYDLIIRKAEDTTKVYFTHVHDHSKTLLINADWKADIQAADLEAEVVLYLDHDGHTASKKVGFKIR